MFKNREPLLLPEIDLYNNLVSIGECQGRLSAKLEINPALRITWEFESLGEDVCFPEMDASGKLTHDILGFNFRLSYSYGGKQSVQYDKDQNIKSYKLKGISVNVHLGDEEIRSKYFRFYLPNARFLSVCFEGSENVSEYRVVHPVGVEPDLERAIPNSINGRYWKCSLGNGWQLHFESAVDKEWFDERGNVGTYLTSRCDLFQADNIPNDNMYSMEDARKLAGYICWLLSFANGGYLGPVVFECYEPLNEKIVIGVYQTTQIELLGDTWVTTESNLKEFVLCFQSFEKIISQKLWKEMYELLLVWYFQAIQPLSNQEKHKPWQVRANALGAAIERLSLAVISEFEPPKGNLEGRIINVLKKIGIESKQDLKMVKIFIKVRNDATHPRRKLGYSTEELYLSLRYALQWIEEILLWRLGYDGAYLRRIPGSNRYAFEKPRYDLNTRKSDW